VGPGAASGAVAAGKEARRLTKVHPCGERRITMGAEHDDKERVNQVFHQLLSMVGEARNAFNRHTVTNLEQLTRLQSEVSSHISSTIQEINLLLPKKPESERPAWLQTHSVLTRLAMVAQNLGGLVAPLRLKIKDKVLFSDKAVSQMNNLFDHQAGMLRTLLDIMKTDNAYLRKYSLEESRKLVQTCNDYATEHETRLIEGVCLPQASPIFLSLLDGLRNAYQHEEQVAQLLAR
jgi:Na+/phosphate symporter